jgi:hypothetical protein
MVTFPSPFWMSHCRSIRRQSEKLLALAGYLALNFRLVCFSIDLHLKDRSRDWVFTFKCAFLTDVTMNISCYPLLIIRMDESFETSNS